MIEDKYGFFDMLSTHSVGWELSRSSPDSVDEGYDKHAQMQVEAM